MKKRKEDKREREKAARRRREVPWVERKRERERIQTTGRRKKEPREMTEAS